MDLKKDEQFQQYYASMTASPSYSSPEQENYYNNGNYNLTSAENNGDDYFYEATEQKQNDTYTDDDEDDAETEEEENEEGLNEQKGTIAFHNDEDDAETEEGATSTAVVAKEKKKRRKRDPNKPKGFVCASLKYANANRQRVKDANPNATSPPTPPEKPTQISGGTTYSEEDNDSMQMIAVQAPKSKRQKKCSSPKMPRTGWQLFSSSRAHQIIKTQHPNCDCNVIQRILGQVSSFS